MKHFFSILSVLLVISVFSQTQKVMIIGIDGCRPDALFEANTPTLDSLISTGLFSPDALNDDVTVSGPGWSAILCGVWSPKHLVTSNSFAGNDYANYPPVFKRVEDYNSALNTVSICHWAPINDEIIQSYADITINESSDLNVSNQAINFLDSNDPDFMFLHYDDVDHAGHAFGFSPTVPQYISAIEAVDGLITPVIQAIRQRPNYASEDWLVLVTTDHGGVGYSHGGTTIEHQNVFVIASGNNVATARIEKDSTVTYDSVYNCLADTVALNFDGVDDNIQVPSSSSFDFGTSQDFSIECRVKTSVSGDVAILGNKDWNSGVNAGFVFSFKYPAGPEWKINIGDGSNRVDINTGGLIADNQWHSLCATFDRSGYLKMYEDGILIDSADISGIGNITTSSELFFCADANSAYYFSGSISEVRCWNTVLDEATIQAWHCSRLDSTHLNYANLIGFWKLNEGGTATGATDYSVETNDGIISGASWVSNDSVVVYDYSETPRITDIAVTAVTHMCIPIDPAWSFDGVSLIPSCAVNIEAVNNSKRLIIYPNPASSKVRLSKPDKKATTINDLRVFQSDGQLILSREVLFSDEEIDVSQFEAGIYFFYFVCDKKPIVCKLLRQ